MSSTRLPEGKTCTDCAHFFTRCRWLNHALGNETTCDWAPSRFTTEQPASAEDSRDEWVPC